MPAGDEGHAAAVVRRVPLNFFGMPFGVAGLAGT